MKEKEILIFSGTSEGRKLAELLLKNGIAVTVCVATEYGREIMERQDHPLLTLRTGRLDVQEMECLAGEKNWRAIVDATHPFAEEVTKNIKAACGGRGKEVLRLLRDQADEAAWNQNVQFVDSVEEAADYLNQLSGNIFLTTGSKSLPEYVEKI
ncbi:MAG: precorrin-6A/cobalt-precorrin-6A reductase, partial [Lachnospiraceae bacterium]|nr:precorrin-6A/cobalt-precorrin-6A reductase [Lachnospiraceae bacterium]